MELVAPKWIGLVGDEDGGVTLVCRHTSHPGEYEQILYLGSAVPPGLAAADDLNHFLTAIEVHLRIHQTADDAAEKMRLRINTVAYRRNHGMEPTGSGMWILAHLGPAGLPDGEEIEYFGPFDQLYNGTHPTFELPPGRWAVLP